MSKKASNTIHELISSMSKSEKRYFKIFSSRHTIGEQNNYILLFDFIESQKVYNEDELVNHFKGEAFLNKFSITKNRLYESILRSLDSYHSSSSVDAKIYRLLHSTEILYNKSLYNQAEKLLISAEKLAKKNEKQVLLLEINKQLKKIVETKGYNKISDKNISEIVEKEASILSNVGYYNKLWEIKSKLFLLINTKGKARSKEDLNQFLSIKKELDKLGEPNKNLSEHLYLYNHTLSAYYFAILEKEESLNYLNKTLAILKKNPGKIKAKPNVYFSTLTNIINLDSQLGNYKKAMIGLEELKTFPKKYDVAVNEDLDIKLFSSKCSIELMLYTKQGEYEKATALAPVIEEGFRLYKNGITSSRKAYLAFKLAVAFFGIDEFNISLQWLNLILNDNKLDDKEDIVSFAQILNLLIHFELKNNRLLPYALKSTQRFLKKRNRTYQFETLFLKYINKIINSKNRFEEEEILNLIKIELSEIKKNPFESVALEYFDFESWLEAKMKQKSFKNVQRQNYISALK